MPATDAGARACAWCSPLSGCVPRTLVAPRRARRRSLPFPYGHEARLVVLARAPPGSPVHVALESLEDGEADPLEDRGIEVAPVVHHDDHRSLRPQRPEDVAEDGGDSGDVLLHGG